MKGLWDDCFARCGCEKTNSAEISLRKNAKKADIADFFSRVEEVNIHYSSNDIVAGMCAGGDSKSSDGEQCCEINTRNSSETELHCIEGSGLSYLPIEYYDVVMGAEQSGRYQDREYDRAFVGQSHQVLEKHHQHAYQDQPEDEFFVDAGPDSRYDIRQQRLCDRRGAVEGRGYGVVVRLV